MQRPLRALRLKLVFGIVPHPSIDYKICMFGDFDWTVVLYVNTVHKC